MENGVIANTFETAAANKNDITDGGKGDEVAILNEVDGESNEKKKRVPSVKVRLFKRLRSNSNSRASKLEFDADDFDVPVQKVIKVLISNISHKLLFTSDLSAKASCVQPTYKPVRLGHPRHPTRRRSRGDRTASQQELQGYLHQVKLPFDLELRAVGLL